MDGLHACLACRRCLRVHPGLSQGAHSLQARAALGDGTIDQTPLTYDWQVDNVAPVITFLITPPVTSTAPSGIAAFVVTATEPDIVVQYSYVLVTTPANVSNVPSLFNSSTPWTSTFRFGVTITNLTTTSECPPCCAQRRAATCPQSSKGLSRAV